MKNITTTIETVTPELARAYLQTMKKNRCFVKSDFESFCRLIRNGQFITTHQGIAFDTDGNLIDGYHRLRAVVETGVEIRVQVTRNLTPDAFSAMDLGKKRNMGDILMTGEKNGKGITEISSFALKFLSPMRSFGPHEVGEMHKIIGPVAKDLVDLAPSGRKGVSIAPVRFACCYWMDNGSYEFAVQQYRALTLLDFDSMTSASKMYVRQILEGKKTTQPIFTRQYDQFRRAMVVFDPSKTNVTKIQVADSEKPKEMVKKWIERRSKEVKNA